MITLLLIGVIFGVLLGQTAIRRAFKALAVVCLFIGVFVLGLPLVLVYWSAIWNWLVWLQKTF